MSVGYYGLPTMFWAIYGAILGFALLLSVGFYILSSLGFYSLAKRRGIANPGLAWVPIGGQDWIIGSLADQYLYVTEGRVKRQRVLLLWLNIAMWAVSVVYVVMILGMTLRGMTGEVSFMPAFMAGFLGGYFLMLVVAIVYAVFLYIALYNVYKSCDPKNATLYLVLSILINVTQPFFVFFSRNKDLGMPPAPEQGGEEGRLNPGQDPAL